MSCFKGRHGIYKKLAVPFVLIDANRGKTIAIIFIEAVWKRKLEKQQNKNAGFFYNQLSVQDVTLSPATGKKIKSRKKIF